MTSSPARRELFSLAAVAALAGSGVLLAGCGVKEQAQAAVNAGTPTAVPSFLPPTVSAVPSSTTPPTLTAAPGAAATARTPTATGIPRSTATAMSTPQPAHPATARPAAAVSSTEAPTTSVRAVGASRTWTSAQFPGTLVALDQRSGYGPPQHGPGEAQVVMIQLGQGAHVLVSGLPAPSPGGPAVSPDGRYIAFGRALNRGPGNQNRPDQQGLWLMQRDGSSLHRLLTPPPSAAGNFLGIGPLAWFADSKTVAYSVQTLGSGVNCPDPAAGGIWLASVTQPQPHRLASAAQLGLLQPLPSGQPGCPLFISRLSWSPDGKRLAVSAYRLKPGATQPGDLEPVILAVDAGSGTARPLVVGGANGAFAPRSGRVAYTTLVYPTATTPAVTTIWVADSDGRHRRKVLTVQGSIFDLVWAPDGRFLAFLDGPTGPSQGPSLRVAGLDGVGCTLLTTEQLQLPPLLHGGSLSGLAWLPTGT